MNAKYDRYLLWARESGDRTPVRARFLVHVQTGPGAHPFSSRSNVVKRSGRGVDHPPPSSAEVKERVELYR
jgi:hypothetical protein